MLTEATHYLLEILEPEDIKMLIDAHSSATNETHRERLIDIMRLFVDRKAGPRLDLARTHLSEAERKALEVLAPKSQEQITPHRH